MSGEFMATNKKLMPPTPTHSAWVAFAVVFPALLVALLSCPIWMSAHGAMRLMEGAQAARSRGRLGLHEKTKLGFINRQQLR
jgi:hypothetical protein